MDREQAYNKLQGVMQGVSQLMSNLPSTGEVDDNQLSSDLHELIAEHFDSGDNS